MKKRNSKEITVYDMHDTTSFIDRSKKLSLNDLGITLPPETPTKVLSIRIPTALLNSIKAYAGEKDIPYAAMIKILLSEGMEKKNRSLMRH
jgi:hypothetical protein